MPACSTQLSSTGGDLLSAPLNCPGTAKAGGGDFVCGQCDGTSMDGRQQYSSKAGATSCSLCPVGGRINGARTTCSACCLLCASARLLEI